MRKSIRTTVAAMGLAMLVLVAGPALADSISIGINTPSVSLGLNIGSPPPLVLVPKTHVYYAPSVPHNYFVYEGYYYVFHEGRWFYSHHYNGPWMGLTIHQVPRPLLAVPVTYYKIPPGHAKKYGPPHKYNDRDKWKEKAKHKHGRDD